MKGTPRVYKHRFCIHLPIVDNDGSFINRKLIDGAFSEIKESFGGFTTTSTTGFPTWFGFWKSPEDGEEYVDCIYIVFVDVEDSKMTDALEFFEDFRIRHMELFNQSEIYIVHYEITKVEK